MIINYEKYLEIYAWDKITTKLTETEFLSELKNCDSVGPNTYQKIFRSVNLKAEYYFIDNSIIERKSAYVGNHYTLIINNSYMWSDFPKRQLICSFNRATDFADNIYVIIPYKNSKWGIVPESDIQNINNIYDICRYNFKIKLSDNSYDELIDDLVKNDVLHFYNNMEPYSNGFKVCSYADLYNVCNKTRPEIWTDSNVLMIRKDIFEKTFNYPNQEIH
jgi:hypothetical protein